MMLLGINCLVDCFVCVLFYINVIFKVEDLVVVLVSVFSVICNVLVLYGIIIFGELNILFMCWCIVVDYKWWLYFFELVLILNIFWVDLNKVDFGGKVFKFDFGLD